MGNEAYRYKNSQENQLMLKRYEKTTKLRTCLKCSNVFMSLSNGHRICDLHKKNSDSEGNVMCMPDTWGNLGVHYSAESSSAIIVSRQRKGGSNE